MIFLKSPEDIAELRIAGRILATILDIVAERVESCVSTLELDLLAEQEIAKAGCRPAFKGYKQKEGDPPFPGTLCTSINDEVVHGVPSRDIRLVSGDIVGIDIGLWYPGKKREYVVDMAKTFPVGKISKNAKKLLLDVEAALVAGIHAMMPGHTLEAVSYAIEQRLKKQHLGIVRDMAGHGVGFSLHEEPCVLNYVEKGSEDQRLILKPGFVLALEPMASLGSYELKLDSDGWTVRTMDGSLSGHFEHTVAVTEHGFEILTKTEK